MAAKVDRATGQTGDERLEDFHRRLADSSLAGHWQSREQVRALAVPGAGAEAEAVGVALEGYLLGSRRSGGAGTHGRSRSGYQQAYSAAD